MAQLRLNALPEEMPLDAPRWELKIGWDVGCGRVEFYAHPIERTKRIVMYASGIALSLAVGIVVSALLPADLNWLRVEILLYVFASATINWVAELRGERWSDGQAIRALMMSHRKIQLPALKRADIDGA